MGIDVIADLMVEEGLSPEEFVQLLQAILASFQVSAFLLATVENIGDSDENARRLATLQNGLRAIEEFTRRYVVGGEPITPDQQRQVLDLLRQALEIAEPEDANSIDLETRYIVAFSDLMTFIADEEEEKTAANQVLADVERAVDEAAVQIVAANRALTNAERAVGEIAVQMLRKVEEIQERASTLLGNAAVAIPISAQLPSSVSMTGANLDGSAPAVDAVREAARLMAHSVRLGSMLALLNLRDGPVLHGAGWMGGMGAAQSDPATDARPQQQKTRLLNNMEQIMKILQEREQREQAALQGKRPLRGGQPGGKAARPGSEAKRGARKPPSKSTAMAKRSAKGQPGRRPGEVLSSPPPFASSFGFPTFSKFSRGGTASSDSGPFEVDVESEGGELPGPINSRVVRRQKRGGRSR
jgi:hypothetical protein